VNFINNRDLSDLQEKLNSEELRESELFILENLNFNPEECGYEIVNDKFLVKNIGSSENLKYFTKLKYVDLITMHGVHHPSSFLENQIFVSKSGAKYSFNSRLESFTFLTKTAILRTADNYNFSETEINELCKSIHYNLINGNYGEGEIIS
jgi:hypothetical protein